MELRSQPVLEFLPVAQLQEDLADLDQVEGFHADPSGLQPAVGFGGGLEESVDVGLGASVPRGYADRRAGDVVGEAHRAQDPPARRAWSWRSMPSRSIRLSPSRRASGRGLRRPGRERPRSVCRESSARRGPACPREALSRRGMEERPARSLSSRFRACAARCAKLSRAAVAAAAKAQAPWRLSVPGRSAPSWPPPRARGSRPAAPRASPATQSAPVPRGPRSLWAEKAAEPAPAARGSKPILPRAWTASTWRRGGGGRRRRRPG